MADNSWISGAIQGVTSLIGLPIQGYLQRKSEERQDKYNKENMEIQQGYARENALMQQGFTRENMELTKQHNKELMQNQFELNEQGAVNAHKRNLDLYHQTQSTQAKVAEMENAGLSIGLLNGTPSAGGASSGGTASVGGQGVGTVPGAGVQTPAMGITQAQTLNIMDTINSLGGNIANIAKTLKETEIADAQADILKIEASMSEKMTLEKLNQLILQNQNLLEDKRGKSLDNNLKVRVFDNQVKLITQQVELNTAELELKDEQKTLLTEQINSLVSNTALAIKRFKWEQNDKINEREFELKLTELCNNFKQQLQKDQQEFEWNNSPYGIANNAIEELLNTMGLEGKDKNKWVLLISKILKR